MYCITSKFTCIDYSQFPKTMFFQLFQLFVSFPSYHRISSAAPRFPPKQNMYESLMHSYIHFLKTIDRAIFKVYSLHNTIELCPTPMIRTTNVCTYDSLTFFITPILRYKYKYTTQFYSSSVGYRLCTMWYLHKSRATNSLKLQITDLS